MTPTRIQALAFADYLAARKAWEASKAGYPTPPVLTIGPAELLELSEAAQERAALVKAIAAETAAIEDECNAADYDENGTWHAPTEDAPVLIADPQAVRMMRAVLVMCAVEAVGGLLIWAAVHFAQKAGLPW